MGKGTVTSDEHVDVKLLNGTLSADRLRITGGGEVVRFEGNVVMNLDNLRRARAARQRSRGSRTRAGPIRPSTRSSSGQERQHRDDFSMKFSPRGTWFRRIALRRVRGRFTLRDDRRR